MTINNHIPFNHLNTSSWKSFNFILQKLASQKINAIGNVYFSSGKNWLFTLKHQKPVYSYFTLNSKCIDSYGLSGNIQLT